MDNRQQISDQEFDSFLKTQEEKELLRFITCGSVDDGKSTLIGRLLYDSKLIFDDQLSALESDSRKHGTQGGDMDFALLVDGLAAEREQGITIDVAYRFFATDKRKFIVADTPGHEQYTRNMATGASTADLAIILIDARKGVLTQTRRHSFLVSLLGISNVILAVNKMDLVDYDQGTFEAIVEDYQAFARQLNLTGITAIPLSALKGDNMLESSGNMPWYQGSCLLSALEEAEIPGKGGDGPFRLPVQWVNRPNLDFRGFSGTLAAGTVRIGDAVTCLPSGAASTVASIITPSGEAESASQGEAVTLTLSDEIDVSRGDVLTPGRERLEVSDQFQAHLIWMNESHLLPGRSYILKSAANQVNATVSELRHKINVNNLEHEAAKVLELNEVGLVNLSLAKAIPFSPYEENKTLGAFILIDRISNETVAAGMINFSLRRAENIHWQAVEVGKATRAEQKHQRPAIIWFTGLSGSGKSTIANLMEKQLHSEGRHTYLLDGDNVRHGLNRDLGFTDADRVENIRRVGEVSKLMLDAGLLVLTAFISPFAAERRMVREMVEDGEFIEVFIDTPLEVCESRDPKGLYEKARQGQIANFTGISSPYEVPENAEIIIDTTRMDAAEAARHIVKELVSRNILPASSAGN